MKARAQLCNPRKKIFYLLGKIKNQMSGEGIFENTLFLSKTKEKARKKVDKKDKLESLCNTENKDWPNIFSTFKICSPFALLKLSENVYLKVK